MVRVDLLLHFLVGFFLVKTLEKRFFRVVLIVAAIAIAKEIYDIFYGHVEFADVVATMIYPWYNEWKK